MTKLRKGSITIDLRTGCRVKLLTSPGKGELPDGLFINIGKPTHSTFINHVLVKEIGNGREFYTPHPYRCNNVRCYAAPIVRLQHH